MTTPANAGSAKRPCTMVEAALWYARKGFPVFPLVRRDKNPLTEHGFCDASTDAARVSDWWTQWPDANIGIPTGLASGWLVLDVDPRNGGDETLEALITRRGRLPETAEQLTGGGGRHIVFRHPGGEVRCGKLGTGIDLKGEGGYVVVAPSVHPSGKPYRWDGIAWAKALLALAAPPSWLLECIGGTNGPQASTGGDDSGPIREGRRNTHLTSLAGTMRRRGMLREAIAAALLEENRRRCDPPLPEAEVRRIAESVARYEPQDAHRDVDSEGTSPHGNWPDELKAEAFHGPAGELVRAIEPHSEADPAALLVQLLVAFGNLIGRRAHFVAEADRHYLNLYGVVVGQTAKARKGTAWGQVRRLLAEVDPGWASSHTTGGFGSGEGVIAALSGGDQSAQDKRLLVLEPEFARVLQVCERQGSTLSAIVRQAWDDGNLQVLTRKDPLRVPEAHVSIIGHITTDELRRLLTDTAAANGFANRVLWCCARRSKCLPEGGALHTADLSRLIRQLREAAAFAGGAGELRRDDQARAVWHEVYPDLSGGKPGLLGAVISRAEAQTMRLACVYALLDGSGTVRAAHLMAALAVWQYCEDSARFIFGDALGDATADEVLRELRNRAEGITRTEIREHFSRNKSSAEIGRALRVLQEYGLARLERGREEEGQRRPTERWLAVCVVRG